MKLFQVQFYYLDFVATFGGNQNFVQGSLHVCGARVQAWVKRIQNKCLLFVHAGPTNAVL